MAFECLSQTFRESEKGRGNVGTEEIEVRHLVTKKRFRGRTEMTPGGVFDFSLSCSLQDYPPSHGFTNSPVKVTSLANDLWSPI